MDINNQESDWSYFETSMPLTKPYPKTHTPIQKIIMVFLQLINALNNYQRII